MCRDFEDWIRKEGFDYCTFSDPYNNMRKSFYKGESIREEAIFEVLKDKYNFSKKQTDEIRYEIRYRQESKGGKQ
jgi:hypothetical protein